MLKNYIDGEKKAFCWTKNYWLKLMASAISVISQLLAALQPYAKHQINGETLYIILGSRPFLTVGSVSN